MKKIFILLSTYLLCFNTAQAQTNVYVMKDGASVAQFDVNTEIDSIIFYDPNNVTPPPITSNVPFFDLTDVTITEGVTISLASDYYQPYGGTPPIQVIYESPLVGKNVGMDVVLPPSYNDGSNKRYPIIIHLHGHGEVNSSIRMTGVANKVKGYMDNADTPEFIFVSAGGPQQTWWSDTWDGSSITNQTSAKAESYVINELLSFCDQQFRTLGTKESRAIMGFSMGGFGATKIGIKYPQYFSVVGSYCGALYGPGPYNVDPNESFVTYQSNYEAIWNNDPSLYANDCARALLPIHYQEVINQGITFVIQNNADQFWGRNQSFKGELEALGITPIYFEDSGVGHNMNNLTALYFNSILNNMVTE